MATIRCLDQRFENIQAVLFDKDGTLANVEEYLRDLGEARSHCINTQVPHLKDLLLTTFGIEKKGIDPSGLMAVGSRYENEVAAAAYIAATGKGWIASLEMAGTAFQKAESSLPEKVTQTPPLAGAKQLLQRLQSAEITLGIVSVDLHSEVTAFIDRYQLSEISWHCGASSDKPAKTHPDFLEFVCRAMDIDPTATLIIGDSASDLRLALQGASGFIGMTGGWRSPPYISVKGRSAVDLRIATVSCLDQVESFD